MGILNKTKTYLVGQIEFGDGRTWREQVTYDLERIGIVCYDPFKKPFVCDLDETEDHNAFLKAQREAGNFDLVASQMKKIRSFDLALVDKADFILAYINPKIMTCGSWEEIFWANRQKKPIFLVIEGGKKACPLWVFGTIPHKYIYDSFADVIQILEEINSGEREIDSDRWRLLKEDFR